MGGRDELACGAAVETELEGEPRGHGRDPVLAPVLEVSWAAITWSCTRRAALMSASS